MKEADIMEDNKLYRKMIKGKYLKDIENGAKEKFKSIYREEITAKSEQEDGVYHIRVYMKGLTIITSGSYGTMQIMVGEYSNEQAIQLFASKYTLEDFLKEYDDYNQDNYKLLEEGINKLIEEYKQYGFKFNTFEVGEYSYYVNWTYPGYKKEYFPNEDQDWGEGKSFCVRPISKATMKNEIRNVKKRLEYSLNEVTLKVLKADDK